VREIRLVVRAETFFVLVSLFPPFSPLFPFSLPSSYFSLRSCSLHFLLLCLCLCFCLLSLLLFFFFVLLCFSFGSFLLLLHLHYHLRLIGLLLARLPPLLIRISSHPHINPPPLLSFFSSFSSFSSYSPSSSTYPPSSTISPAAACSIASWRCGRSGMRERRGALRSTLSPSSTASGGLGEGKRKMYLRS